MSGQPLRSTAPARNTLEGGFRMANVPFTNNDCGKTSGTTTPVTGALKPGDQVEINGSIDLSKCIVGNSEARVYSITLQKQSGFFAYVLDVVAQGPSGWASGWLYLYFTDETGDKYSLGIFLSSKQQHTVAYNSDRPGIVKIEWGD
jgi:hypothetical protein